MGKEIIINSLEEMCDLMCGDIESDYDDYIEEDNIEETVVNK